jgi:hypothetical protein
MYNSNIPDVLRHITVAYMECHSRSFFFSESIDKHRPYVLCIVPILVYVPPKRVGSRYSVVGIATGYELDGRDVGVRVPVGSRIFSSPSSLVST